MRRALAALGVASGAAFAAYAETLIVGPEAPAMTIAQAAERARDGDVIALLSGDYKGQAAVLVDRKLTLRGVGNRPVIRGEGKVAERRALIVVRGGEVVLENLEFRGSRAADADGAGVRLEGGTLTVRHCAFFDNENGIFAANVPTAELTIVDSEFGRAPRVEGGLHHLLNVGRIARLSVRGSRFHSGFEGHLIKTRARENRITYNLINDGPEGQASYELDIALGGVAWVIGNVIGQSAGTQNPVVLAYGTEGSAWDKNALYVSHNTFIGEPWPPSWFLRVFDDKLPAATEVRAVNNLSVGLGLFSPGTRGDFAGNHWLLRRRSLQSYWSLEFGLPFDSDLRGQGVDPGMGGGESLAPTAEFVLPVGTRAIDKPAAWSPGAIQK